MSDTINEENKKTDNPSEAASVQPADLNDTKVKEDPPKTEPVREEKKEEQQEKPAPTEEKASPKKTEEKPASADAEKTDSSGESKAVSEKAKKDTDEKKTAGEKEEDDLDFLYGERHPSERNQEPRERRSSKPVNPFAGFSFRKMIPILVIAVIMGGLIAFIAYFHVESVQIMTSTYYSDDEVRSMVLTGPAAENTFLAPIFLNRSNVEEYPFVEGFSVTRIDHHTLAVALKEMKPVGCIPFLDSYIYFDRNGLFAESSMERDTVIPFFKDIQVDTIVKGEKLALKGTAILDTAVILSNTFQKIEQIPEYIAFDASGQVNLYYGDITVQLGKAQYLEDKMSRVNAIMQKIEGRKGILHVESVNEHSKIITFEEEVIEITAENWPGGYDENGDYDGVGEYDADGKYVGPRPHEAYDDAMDAWAGGYDGEGDYTGSGEYDIYGNYVGTAPTREEFRERHAEWTGGWTEDGRYDGTSPFDQEGYYIGPNPNGSESSESSESESGDYYDEESDDYYENYDGYDYDESYDYDDGYYDESYYDESYYDESYYDESYYDEGY